MIALILTLSAFADDDQPDTGPVPCYEWNNELYASTPMEGQQGVPTDVAPAFYLREACADGEEGTHSWRLVNEDTHLDVASGAIFPSPVDGLASPEGWVALEPNTSYRLIVNAQPGDVRVEGGSFVFFTGAGPSAGGVQPPTLFEVKFRREDGSPDRNGPYVLGHARVTPWPDPEAPQAVLDAAFAEELEGDGCGSGDSTIHAAARRGCPSNMSPA